MSEELYTLAMWKVKPGHQQDFVEAWKALGSVFRKLPHPPVGKGVLLQNLNDPNLHYSFGPWASAEDISAMRADEGAQAAIQQVIEHCTEAMPGGYSVVAEA